MITCKESVEAMASERRLSVMEWAKLQLHLLICRRCAVFHKHLRILGSALRNFVIGLPELTPSELARLEEQILARLRKQKGS